MHVSAGRARLIVWWLVKQLDCALPYKQEFAIFRQRPFFVIHDELKLVDMVADFIKKRKYFSGIGKGSFPGFLNVIGLFAGLDHIVNFYLF